MSIALKLSIQRPGFDLSIDTCLPERGITGLFGASGAGKTSVLRCIAGLERGFSSGLPNHSSRGSAHGAAHISARIQVGEEIWQDDTRFLPPHRRSVGYVFQEASLLPHLSVRGNLEYGLKRVESTNKRASFGHTSAGQSSFDQISFDNVVSLLGLSSLLQRDPEQLSGGERQRVAIARALLTRPKLLLMDEPLASLDDDSKASILNYIAEVQAQLNIPTLYVTHSTSEIIRLADHLLILDAGRITAEGAINDLLTRGDLPLAHHADAGVMLNGTVTGRDDKFHLSLLDVPGGQLAVSTKNLALKATVRVRLLARDISLTLIKPEQSSIQNILQASVSDIIDGSDPNPDPAQVLIKLDLGGCFCLARITRRAVHQLDLRKGTKVFAQIKSVAVVS